MSIPNYFSESQLALLEQNPEYKQRGKKCPVCLGDGHFFYEGERFECPDDDYGHVALRTAKLYWLAFIPLEYQYLIWDEFPNEDVKREVDEYLTRFERVRLTGAGFTIHGKDMGVGKTWVATHVLRELVKRGYTGLFQSWFGLQHNLSTFDVDRLVEPEVLVFDDIRPAISDQQRLFYEEKVEMILRLRTTANFPTIVTTNLSMDEFEEEYPRCYSLLVGKNIELPLQGKDARRTKVWNAQKLALKGESRPIT